MDRIDISGSLPGGPRNDNTWAPLSIGDRVTIKSPHDPAHKTGTVQLISGDTPYGVLIDGMESMGVHKWYVGDELEPGSEDGSGGVDGKKKPMKMLVSSSAGGQQASGPSKSRYFARAAGTRFDVVKAEASPTVVELYDEIGYWGVTARDFRDRIRDINGDFTLRLNSPGGDVFDGIAMFNDLLAHKGKVRVEIAGLAASIASVIAMAGDEIVIGPNAFFMVHNAWTGVRGNRHDMRDAADVMEQIDEAIVRTYVGRTKTGIRAVKEMMDAETWLSAKDAVAKGFADSLMTPAAADDQELAVAAKFDLTGVFAKVPDALRWSAEAEPESLTPRDIERELMRDAGPRSRSQARALMRACKQSPQDAMHDAGSEGLKSLLDTIRAANSQLNPAK